MAELPEIFSWLAHRMDYQVSELYQTFNMGLGFVLATDRPHEVLNFCREHKHNSWIIGQTISGVGNVELTTAFGRSTFVD
jgi:phosphoribosylformylglycinamidine cyclo-ligase